MITIHRCCTTLSHYWMLNESPLNLCLCVAIFWVFSPAVEMDDVGFNGKISALLDYEVFFACINNGLFLFFCVADLHHQYQE